MKKLLLMVVSLFAMGTMAVYADYQLDLTTANYGQWNDGDSYEINADGSVTMTFYQGWSGTGWQNWGSPWDLTQYESVVVEYTGLEAINESTDHPWIQLYIGSSPAIGQGDWSQTGRIEFVMADNATDEDGNEIDYSSVGQIMIQPSDALVVTITSVTFVGGSDAGDTDHSGSDYDELPMDEDSDLSCGWSSSYDGATHTITYDSAWAGRGWWFGNPDGKDCSAYEGVEVVIKTSLVAYVSLTAQYNYFEDGSDDGLTTTTGINTTGSDEEVTIYCAFDETMRDNVMQIWIQCGAAGTIELVSAKLIKAAGEGGDLVFECDGLYYEVIVEEEVDDEGNVVSTTPTENCKIICPADYTGNADEAPYAITDLTIPATASNGSATYNVTRLETNAFAYSAVAGTVTIPYNIVSTGVSCFEGCSAIENVVFEEGEDLYDDNDSNGAGGYMFGSCPAITEVTVNRDIYCGSNTRLCAPFTYNTSINTIFIGENVTRLPAYMFRNTSNGALKTVTIYAETPIGWRYDPFSNKTGEKIPVLYVHEASLDAYNSAAGTDEVAYTDIFEQILAIESVAEGITEVAADVNNAAKGTYNLAGQRVSDTAKGLLIKDGKKVLVK